MEDCFKINKYKQWYQRKIIHYSCEDRIDKSVLRDHCLASVRKPCNAKWRSLGRIFYSTLTLMIDSYNIKLPIAYTSFKVMDIT